MQCYCLLVGYIVRKLRKIVCSICVANITSDICDENECHELIKESKCKSDSLIDILSHIEMEYRKVIDEVIYSSRVEATLVSTLGKNVS